MNADKRTSAAFSFLHILKNEKENKKYVDCKKNHQPIYLKQAVAIYMKIVSFPQKDWFRRGKKNWEALL